MSTTLTDRRMQRTREDIARVALELFLAHGFDRTTVEEIAATAQVSPRTVFRYFTTKEDLLLSFGQIRWTSFLQAVAERPTEETGLTAVTVAIEESLVPTWTDGPRIRAFYALITDTPTVRGRWFEQAHHVQLQLADVLAAREGRRHRALSDLVLAGAITTAISTGLQFWAERDGKQGPGRFIDQALRQLATPLLTS